MQIRKKKKVKRNYNSSVKVNNCSEKNVNIATTNPNITSVIDSDGEAVSVFASGIDRQDDPFKEYCDNDTNTAKNAENSDKNAKTKAKKKVQRSFASSAILLATAGMVAKIIGAIYRIPLTNLLGVEGIGLYQLVFPIYALMLTLSSSAIPTAIARLVSERNALGDYIGGRKVFRSSAILLVSTGIVATLIMIFLSAQIGRAHV